MGKKYFYNHKDVNIYCFSSFQINPQICTGGLNAVIEWNIKVIIHDTIEVAKLGVKRKRKDIRTGRGRQQAHLIRYRVKKSSRKPTQTSHIHAHIYT